MIQCPSCKHKEMVGALFCSECGTQLVFSPYEASYQTTIHATITDILDGPMPPPFSSSGEEDISLSIMDTGEILPLAKRDEITLGRISEGQSILPDIDLSPYHAYEAGVSRLHAAIKIVDQQTSIVDLGSANGTRVNGKKIPPLNPHPISNGDVLTLGRFKIQVLIRT